MVYSDGSVAHPQIVSLPQIVGLPQSPSLYATLGDLECCHHIQTSIHSTSLSLTMLETVNFASIWQVNRAQFG